MRKLILGLLLLLAPTFAWAQAPFSGASFWYLNAGSTGTTLYSLAKISGSSGSPANTNVVISATTDAGCPAGVVIAGAGTSGSAQVATSGKVLANFDGGTTVNDWVVPSITTAGDVHDTGSTTPPSGGCVLGQAQFTESGAGLYQMTLSLGQTGHPSNVNAQTGTTYTIAATDNGKTVTFSNAAAVAVTLPQAGTAGFAAGYHFFAEDLTTSTGLVTVTPTTSTINGASTLAIRPGRGLIIVSDGTNYQIVQGDFRSIAELTVTTAQSPTVADCQKAYIVTSAATITLPLTTTLTSGCAFWVKGQGATATVHVNGSDSFNGGAAGTGTSYLTGNGALIVTDANGNWYDISGGGGGGGSGTVSSGTATQMAVYTGSTTVGSDANLVDTGPNTNFNFNQAVVITPVALSATSHVFTPVLSGSGSSNQFTVLLEGATETIANPTGAIAGEPFTLAITNASGGGDNVSTWGNGYSWVAGSAPTIAQGASAVTLVQCQVIATTPTMQCYGPVSPTNATGTIASPTAPSSTSAYLMQGLAGSGYSCTGCSFTPKTSGTVLIILDATATALNTTVGNGLQCQLSYGTGTAPTANSTLAGTQIGTVKAVKNPAAITSGDGVYAFSQSATVTGLTAGTTYWVDEACEALTNASEMALDNVNVLEWEH